MKSEERQKLKCDCHGSQTMAVKRGEKLVVEAEHHGQVHYLVVDLAPQKQGKEGQ